MLKGTPWGLEYTFSSGLLVTTRPIHILVFTTDKQMELSCS